MAEDGAEGRGAAEGLGWAGGAEQAAARAELERLKRFGDALRGLTERAARITDPAERAAAQDRNLEAFEAMTARVGLLALERMREIVGALAEDGLSDAPDGAARAEARIAAAQEEIDRARDRESAALLRALGAALDGAAPAPAAAGERFDPFEPFDAGPAAPGRATSGRATSGPGAAAPDDTPPEERS